MVNRKVGVMNVSVEWRRIETNPIRATKKLKAPGRLRFLTPEEIHKLLACCPPPPRPLLDTGLVALATGMRRGERLGLKGDSIRRDNRPILLPVTIVNDLNKWT